MGPTRYKEDLTTISLCNDFDKFPKLWISIMVLIVSIGRSVVLAKAYCFYYYGYDSSVVRHIPFRKKIKNQYLGVALMPNGEALG